MRLLLGLLFLGLCVSEVQAQLLPLQYDTTERSQEIIVNAGGEYMGNAVQNQLANKFLFGGTITDEIKDASFDKHKAINRFGGVLNGEIEYIITKSKFQMILTIKLCTKLVFLLVQFPMKEKLTRFLCSHYH